jgi:hypothetical protein
MILFDRDADISIFQNFRGYNDLIDDGEWLLERTSQKSKGFIIRLISNGKQDGVWIGEYDCGSNQIIRQDILFDRNTSFLNKLVSNYLSNKITEKEIKRKIAVNELKKKIKSEIIQDFKYYFCPIDRSYYSCNHIKRIFDELIRKYGKNKKISYSEVAKEIEFTKPSEVIVCPLIVPNVFERMLNLKKAIKSHKLGEIKLIRSDMVELH